jgi:hypothetical protein
MNESYAKNSISSFGNRPVVESDYYLVSTANGIVKGDTFSCFVEFELAGSATKICQLKTGSRPVAFYGVNLQSNALAFTFQMYESPTITDGITPVPLVNMNRISNGSASYQIFSDPTSVSGGTMIKLYRHFTSPAAKSETTMAINGVFLLLKPNTSYSMHFTNGDDATRNVFAQTVITEL